MQLHEIPAEWVRLFVYDAEHGGIETQPGGAWDPTGVMLMTHLQREDIRATLAPPPEVIAQTLHKDLSDPATWAHAGSSWQEDFWTGVAGVVAGFTLGGVMASGFAELSAVALIEIPAALQVAAGYVIGSNLSNVATAQMTDDQASAFETGVGIGTVAQVVTQGIYAADNPLGRLSDFLDDPVTTMLHGSGSETLSWAATTAEVMTDYGITPYELGAEMLWPWTPTPAATPLYGGPPDQFFDFINAPQF